MKFLKLLFLCMTLFTTPRTLYAEAGSGLNWQTNYDEAVSQSRGTSKPIVLFFTGSDWCSWCNKLDSEVFDTKDFQDAAGNKFIFVKLDFPRSKRLDARTTAQNKQLQERYNVRGYPTVIVLDSNQKQIGSTGYKQGGGKAYAAHLLKMTGN